MPLSHGIENNFKNFFSTGVEMLSREKVFHPLSQFFLHSRQQHNEEKWINPFSLAWIQLKLWLLPNLCHGRVQTKRLIKSNLSLSKNSASNKLLIQQQQSPDSIFPSFIIVNKRLRLIHSLILAALQLKKSFHSRNSKFSAGLLQGKRVIGTVKISLDCH